ncbi:sporulation protein YkvU [Shouchella clausii]|uniref:polysaccharide biosynthesis protein n=1 Tax=Shouchella TaxID=2893057 RepID=UPI00079BF6B1|nr:MULTISPECIES: polysaccharide biosynthesis protein [Shouchella]MCM3311532.1 polysaccharide biosynthesis protein [Psychrobacillus sp. MER TA 17]KKI85581.1 multidrug transporter MatE [Shouchella clausii]MDO7269876.1 polysaccharide biosynthesis protein [Shouchella clausii]MDO7285210.1 polysaccharide biosynthesis protein [Shouchella clausii]MDO7289734.1 polysaccharide biosynthesis protein [Shouchella clausii]
MNTFFRGVLVLSAAAFVGECLEFMINVVLARELGDEAFGLYMAILPTMLFVVVLASIELPVSVSKLIAEKEPVYHWHVLGKALQLAFVCALAVMIGALIVFPHLSVLHSYHAGVRWMLVLLVPIITFSSVARGYLMGAQETGKIAVANLLKRSTQLAGLLVVFKLFSFESHIAIFMALLALKLSELFVLIYLVIVFIGKIRETKKAHVQKKGPKKEVYQKLLQVSLPTTGLRIFHSATFAIKPFLITKALSNAGMIESVAMVQYGKLSGIAFTIGFFPAFIAHALLVVLIPIVSDAYAKRHYDVLHHYLRLSLLVTVVYGAPVVLAFFFFAEPITTAFFGPSPAAGYLQVLIPYFLFHYFSTPLQAYLIGIGLVKDAFLHSLYATTVSFCLMIALGSMPSLKMDGIILGMNMGAVLLTSLHYVTICKKLNLNALMRPGESWIFK